MAYKKFIIFVEGQDDEIFFEKFKKYLKQKHKYDFIEIQRYAQKKPDNIKKHLTSLNIMVEKQLVDYVFTSDEDKLEQIQDYGVGQDKLIEVIKEIEGWYLAGLIDTDLQKEKIKHKGKTDKISKEKFDALIKHKLDKNSSRIAYLLELLNKFNIDVAKERNTSFNNFACKYEL